MLHHLLQGAEVNDLFRGLGCGGGEGEGGRRHKGAPKRGLIRGKCGLGFFHVGAKVARLISLAPKEQRALCTPRRLTDL
jgi:hypothetical protein